MDMKNLVIGCGFAGASIARKLAEAGEQAEIIERRAHIGGNAYDAPDAYGILIHVYGPHIFHTNDEEVYRFHPSSPHGGHMYTGSLRLFMGNCCLFLSICARCALRSQMKLKCSLSG